MPDNNEPKSTFASQAPTDAGKTEAGQNLEPFDVSPEGNLGQKTIFIPFVPLTDEQKATIKAMKGRRLSEVEASNPPGYISFDEIEKGSAEVAANAQRVLDGGHVVKETPAQQFGENARSMVVINEFEKGSPEVTAKAQRVIDSVRVIPTAPKPQ